MKDVLVFTKEIHMSGGVQNYILNNYKAINKEKINMNFVIPNNNSDETEELSMYKDSNNILYYVEPLSGSLIRRFLDLKKIMKNYNDDVPIHIHVTDGRQSLDGILIRLLRKNNIIFHSHNASFKRSITKEIASLIFSCTGTLFLGCTPKAGEYLFGKKIVKGKKYHTVLNGINLKRFEFNNLKRTHIRRKYKIDEDDTIVLYAGRFSKEKNIDFILDIIKINKKKSNKFFFIGSGPEEDKIKKILSKYENVFLLSAVTEIEDYMSAADLLLLPSEYESFGMVVVEAQANGLPSIVSVNVPRDVTLTDMVKYETLDIEKWINYINNFSEKESYQREEKMQIKKLQKFDINNTVLYLEQIYINKQNER